LNPSKRLYNLKVPVIGLTGGIASGKSSVSKILSEKYNFPLICADKIIKEIYSLEETVFFIKNHAPKAYQSNGIDFSLLRKIFFSNPSLQTKIENFLYPKIKTIFLKKFNDFDQKNKINFVIYDVPLLFEKKIDDLVDLSICVYCTPTQQKDRLINRDCMNAKLSDRILATQLSIEEKRSRSNFYIDNTNSLSFLEQETDKIIEQIFQY
jgi:dephospho-CoA kinase